MGKHLTIIKDSTASAFQHWGILLKCKPDKLKYFNLMGEKWCDTYKYILLNERFEKIRECVFFQRKIWKNFIMIIGYNSSIKQNWLKVVKILEKLGIEKNIIDQAWPFANDLYGFVKHDFFQENFIKNKSDIKKLKKINFSNGDIINLSYYLSEHDREKSYDVKYKGGRRWIITKYKTIIEEDLEGFNISFDANLIHSYDSYMSRWIIIYSERHIFVIHDCFCVNIRNYDFLLEIISLYFAEKLEIKDLYNFFIVL